MTILKRSWNIFLSLVLSLVLVTTTVACSSAPTQQGTNLLSPSQTTAYSQIERGNTPAGQDFGSWVVQTANGLVQDAYVRDNDKLGVVITPQVSPSDVRTLARSLVQGFQRNFPQRDLTVLVYAPDKKLILTAQYDNQSRQIQYQ